MGAFYGSVHVRTDDVAGLRRTLEDLASQWPTRFLLAPAANGWITVYPSDHGQDTTVSAAIAARIPAPVLHLLVHDASLFAYTLHDVGGLIDEYCSNPDYFEESLPARWEETAGRPDVLAALAGDGDAAPFATALKRDGEENAPFRAQWQLEQLAEALGIANVETSYEYMQAGETRGVRGFKNFVHIPDLSAEKQARRRRQAEVAAETKRLQAEGVLLLAKKRAGTHPVMGPVPVFCASPGAGFLLAWADFAAAAPDEALERWHAPWQEPSETGLRVSSKVHRMRASPSGRFLGVGHAYGDWSAQLFDLVRGQALTRIALPRAIDHISFGHDEQTLICRSEGELRLVLTAEGHAERSMTLGRGRSATLHPDGEWLVADIQGRDKTALALIDVREQRVARLLSTKANDFAAWRAAVATEERVPTGFYPQEVPNRLEFTGDGRLLVLAVNEGVRVYSWQDVLRADEALPPAVVAADTDVVRIKTSRLQNTYGFAIDPRRGLVLFAALDGHVRALDLGTGKASTLFEVPGTPPVIDLAIAEDGTTIAVTACPGMFSDGKRPPPLFQIWNVSACLGRSGLGA